MARPDTFTKEEIEWLKYNYADKSWDEILEHVNHTKTQIVSRAHKLGIRRVRESCNYTPEEDTAIKEFYESLGYAELNDRIEEFVKTYFPHRTVNAIRLRAHRLGCTVRKKWMKEEDEYLKCNYLTMTVNELTSHFDNHSRESVYNRMRMLGLINAPTFAYSEADREFIKNNYLVLSDEEIGEVLHRRAQSIKECRRKLGMYRVDRDAGTHYLDMLRFLQANNTQWKKESMIQCDYKCVITNGAFDDIHHLYAKNLILNDALKNLGLDKDAIDINTCSEEIRNSILNEFISEQAKHPLGVCLTKNLHRAFHIKYGFGNNTPEQFEEFVNNISQSVINEDKIA